ncbi:MAG: hypothetical protein NTU44_14650 [Bacteroidetes bacterium]|nr:hypothetical protein [Bacteroidota bacterium]
MNDIFLEKNFPKHPNNIQKWMEMNLSKADYDRLMKEIPGKIHVTTRTWTSYRKGRSEIGLTTLSAVYAILKPYGCQDLQSLIIPKPVK